MSVHIIEQIVKFLKLHLQHLHWQTVLFTYRWWPTSSWISVTMGIVHLSLKPFRYM